MVQVLGAAGVLAGALADGDGHAVLSTRVPAGSTPFVRAEVRRPAGGAVDPTQGVPALPMVALTNPILLGSASSEPPTAG